jgi:hypothetical protein
VPIREASAKVRSGGPEDDDEDYLGNTWAGVVPTAITYGAPVADDLLREGIPVPGYLDDLSR